MDAKLLSSKTDWLIAATLLREAKAAAGPISLDESTELATKRKDRIAEASSFINDALSIAKKGDWKAAASLLTKAIDTDPYRPAVSFRHASWFVLAEDAGGFDRWINELLRRINPTLSGITEADRASMERTAKAALLRPDACESLDRAMRVGRASIASAPDDYYSLRLSGLIDVRGGEYERGIEKLESLLSEQPRNTKYDTSLSLWIAIAHAKSGQMDVAREKRPVIKGKLSQLPPAQSIPADYFTTSNTALLRGLEGLIEGDR